MEKNLKILIGLFLLFLIIVIGLLIYNTKSKYSNKLVIIPKKDNTEELVVVVCNEDVEEWLDNYAPKYQKVTVYNKCGRNLKFNSKNVEVIQSPNIGSCDHGFLTYIIDRYNDLPDFIEFTKGSKPPIRKYYECLNCKKDIKTYNTSIHNFKLLDHVYGNPINQKAIKTKYIQSKHKNMGDWIKSNDFLDESMYIRNICNILYGGNFGISSENIRKTPKTVWENMRSQQKHPREEVDHYIERTWGPLLCKPKYTLVIVAIFKNESHCIREWIQHYMRQGVEYFYMINNDSTDDWENEITGLPVTVHTSKEKHAQVKLYNDYFLNEVKKQSEWVIVVDLDEFMYSRNEYITIKDYLLTLDNNIGEVRVRWKMFGSSNHIKQPKNIITGFIHRKLMQDSSNVNPDKETKNPKSLDQHVKSICRTINLEKLDIHCHNHNGKILVIPEKANETLLNTAPLHLNHYAIQSWDWFSKIKMTRGAADNKNADNHRNKDYFKKYDFNDIEDTELLNIYSQRLPLYYLHDKDGNIISNTSHEVIEQEILKNTLKNNDRVLQLGGNIGTSCISASKLANLDINHCVEPQSFLTPILKNNINISKANSTVIEGIVSENCKNKTMSSNEGTLGSFITNSDDRKDEVKCNSLHDIKPKNGYTYLFMDCEGCVPDFINEYSDELSKHPIHTIVYEEDQGDRLDPVDYTPVNNFMKQNNFICNGKLHKVCTKKY